MPDEIDYDAATERLHVGNGVVENVEPEVWRYEVSGKQVLLQWFSYRKKNRARPMIGDRRTPSPLGNIQPEHWLAEYTTELINVLNVLGWLVEIEPQQASILERICAGSTISAADLRAAGALEVPATTKQKRRAPTATPDLFETLEPQMAKARLDVPEGRNKRQSKLALAKAHLPRGGRRKKAG